MGALHLTWAVVAATFAVRTIARLLDAESAVRRTRVSRVVAGWGAIFVAVTMQIMTSVRPIVGPATLEVPGKQLFVTHWLDVLSGSEP
jgi:hypothetical protein